jgi:hypothetical protein
MSLSLLEYLFEIGWINISYKLCKDVVKLIVMGFIPDSYMNIQC